MGTYEQIRGVDEAYGKAVANQDIDAIVALYTPDAFFLPPNSPIAKGSDAIRAVLQAYIDAGANSLDLDTTVLDEQGDVVIEVGQYKLGCNPPALSPLPTSESTCRCLNAKLTGRF